VSRFAPLAGLRVLDLSRILAGPSCTQLLADFGAEVIKIEQPGRGDDTRRWGPPFLRGTNGEEVSAYFLSCNRGKRSVAIDFAQPDGAALVRALAAQADVVVENFRPGTLARYDLDAATLRVANPRLVYASISGFGQTGPLAQRSGYDAMIQAEAGLMSLTGEAGGEAQKVGVAVSDLMCGMYAATAILAALAARTTDGGGCHLDLALFDTQVSWLANQGLNYLVSGAVPPRFGTAHPNIVPYQTFATADGRLMLAVGNDAQFCVFCNAIGAAALADDARFATNAGRVVNREALLAALDPLLRACTSADWETRFNAIGVPCGPVNDLAAVFAHPQVAARGLVFDADHPTLGVLPQIANPVRGDDAPARATLPPPRLGEHTDAVLTEIGLDAAAIARLRDTGVVAGP